MKLKILLLFLFISTLGFSQSGKDGSITVTTANTVLNRYTRVTADITAGSNTVTVSDINDLNGAGIGYLGTDYTTNASAFASNALSKGDLIIIYQAQGAQINTTNTVNYGEVTSMNGAGSYEIAYVESVSGNTITLGCGTKLAYYASRYVQLIRIPQYTTLTIDPLASISAVPWGYPSFGGADESALERRRGGFVAIVADNVLNNGSINANEAGFRGGTRENATSSAGVTLYSDYVTSSPNLSAEKGEGIAGYRDDYDLLSGRYGRGAPANAGGGGNAHNAGGGGGANGGILANWFNGAGVMNSFGTCGNPGAWTLDPDYIANGNALTNSSGGGRGGYTYSGANMDACSLPPSDMAWGGDRRDPVGGLGGRPVTSSGFNNQVFMGGGGGAGDGNNMASADGGDGGGIVFMVLTGNITGTGVIESNGQNGFETIEANNDAPGGGGGGGTVLIQANTISNTQAINAKGGKGGDQGTIANEAEGPGGGGGGGVVSINATTDSSSKNINGGLNGNTESLSLTEFTANGATSGNIGTNNSITTVNLKYEMCQTDVGVTMSVSSTCAAVGTNVTFTITATNNGTINASGVTVTDALPSGYTYVSSTPSTGTYTSGTGIWDIGALASGVSRTLIITATVKAIGTYLNSSTVTITQTDTNAANNTASATIGVAPSSAPTVSTSTPANSCPTITVNLTSLVTSTTPVGGNLLYKQTNSSGGVDIPDPTIVGAGTYYLFYRSAEGCFSNSTSVTVTINNCADLSVTKIASNLTPTVGANVTFTITATNNGPSTATSVVVSDVLPAGYSYVSDDSGTTSTTYINNTGMWTVGTLVKDATKALNIVARVL